MANLVRCVLGLVLLLMLTACSQPLPEDRMAYAGLWKSDKITLHIDPGGYVNYERVEKSSSGSTSTSVNAPLKHFDNDNFVVGIAFLTTTFEVTQAPTRVNGVWEMVVDGERLVRVER